MLLKVMTQKEIENFLSVPRHAVVGTNRVDGSPQLSPVWYVFEKEHLYFIAGVNSAKVRNLSRDPRVSVCIDGCYPDFRVVIIYGSAKLYPPNAQFTAEMCWRILRRYYETEEEACRSEESQREIQRMLIEVIPLKIIAQDDN